MARYLWPLLAILVILSIGAPCVTFYILIKDYWAELSHLRQQLLVCQFSLVEPSHEEAFLFSDALLPSKQTSKEQEQIRRTLPFQMKPLFPPGFNSPQQEGMEGHSATDVEQVTFETPSREDIGAFVPTQNLPEVTTTTTTDSGVTSQTSPASGFSDPRKRLNRVTRTTPSLLPFGHILPNSRGWMVADEGQDSQVASSNTQGCYDVQYVGALERRVLDLTSRVGACRKCLRRRNRKEGRCGGSGWKEFRRKEKKLRKKIKQEKRQRRKGGGQRKAQIPSLSLTTTLGEPTEKANGTKNKRNATSSPENHVEEEPDMLFSDIGFIPGWRTGEGPGMSAHTMRENHRASTDFRRGFNQKISRMDEALMQFSETQSAFCKELRDNLGGRLKKRGMEMEALSSQITSLVRTTTMQVSMLEKLMTDQVFAGQQSIEKNLAKTQALQDEQVRNIKAFQKKTFLPAMLNLLTLLGEQASAITNMGVELITKIEVLQDLHLTFSTQQSDTLLNLSESVEMFSSKQGNLLMRSQDHARHIHMNTEKFIHELQSRMNNVVKELVLIRLQSKSFVALSKDTYSDISNSLNKTHNVMRDLSLDLKNKMNTAKETHSEFKQMFTQETDLINERAQSGISGVLMLNHAAVNQIGESELETKVFGDQSVTAWNELYLNQETELRLDADMLANNLRSHNHHTQNILTGLQGTAETHEQVLEGQRADFQNFVRKRQDALDSQCTSISDWAHLMSSELRRRDEDIHRFISEEIRYSPVAMDHRGQR